MNKTAILDMDSIAYAIGHGNKVLDEFGTPLRTEDGSKFIYTEKTDSELLASADFIMNQILNKSGCNSYIGFVKGINTIASRLKYNPDYKQDRSKESPKWWNLVSNYLINSYKIYLANNYEVDDYVVSFLKENKDSFIVAIDSDILGTEGTHYNWKKEEWITTTKEEEIYNFWSQMIIGSHNNVEGLKGKGIKYFERLFNLHIKDKKNTVLYATMILTEYITYYGEENGIKEYYKNYFSLKLRNDLDTSMYYPIEWKQNTIEDINYGID
jgi:hypothetical protein